MNDTKDEKKVESRCEDSVVQFLLDENKSRFSELRWGYHTARIARALQKASDDLLAGKSTYLLVNVPPRHGKSELCSRRFPVWHLLRQPDHEVILATYGEALSHDLSRHARRCFSENATKHGMSLAKDRRQLGCWNIEAHRGGMVATGLNGSLTGRGADILIVDDYVKNRADAESDLRRDRTWDGFRSDLMSRLGARACGHHSGDTLAQRRSDAFGFSTKPKRAFPASNTFNCRRGRSIRRRESTIRAARKMKSTLNSSIRCLAANAGSFPNVSARAGTKASARCRANTTGRRC